MVSIKGLQLENVKRVKAFSLEPAETGLTVIGGKNGQGKSTTLHAIAWALGGNKFAPTNAQHDGAMNPPTIRVELSNGLVVERRGKNSTLVVTDPTGKRHGQQLLDSLVSTFALDLSRFMSASDREKAQILLGILGIGDDLLRLTEQEKTLYAHRHAIGQVKLQKEKAAADLPEFPDAPDEPVSASDLIQQQQAILLRNAENQKLRDQRDRLRLRADTLAIQVQDLKAKLRAAEEEFIGVARDLETAEKSAADLHDESTAELAASLESVEQINAHVAANAAKAKAYAEAEDYSEQYDALTQQLEQVRKERLDLLHGADLPLPELAIEDGVLLYRGKAWDCMSGSEQLRVTTAIVRRLKPECGFVLLDGIEQFDLDTLREFGTWLEQNQLQAISTRVSTGDECTVIIEDGLPAGKSYIETVAPLPESAAPEQPASKWEGGW